MEGGGGVIFWFLEGNKIIYDIGMGKGCEFFGKDEIKRIKNFFNFFLI